MMHTDSGMTVTIFRRIHNKLGKIGVWSTVDGRRNSVF